MTPETFWAHVNKRGPVISAVLGPCWLWTGGGGAYGAVRCPDGSDPDRAHRVAYRLSIGETKGLFVCHRCDNPRCVNPKHLFLGTTQDNNADKVAKGRQARGAVLRRGKVGDANPSRQRPECLARGEAHGRAKLNAEDVREIRRARAAGAKLVDIARRFGIARTTVGGIVRGEEWSHVQ